MELQLLLNTIENMIGQDVKVNAHTVQKGDKTLTGITIGEKDSKVNAIVYVENYDDLFQEKGYIAVASEMIKVCKCANEEYHFNTEEITTWDYAKENLLLCIAPAGTNNGFVTFSYLDLELYFRVKVSEEGTYRIKEEMLGIWSVTKEDVLRVALETNEYVATSMKDVMIEMLMEAGAPDDEIAEMLCGNQELAQTVVTNPSKLFGASAIYKTEILKEIADKYESDLYVIPSSIHELILLPTCGFSPEEIDRIIRETNESSVPPEERLSDHVYIFRRDTMEIEY